MGIKWADKDGDQIEAVTAASSSTYWSVQEQARPDKGLQYGQSDITFTAPNRFSS